MKRIWGQGSRLGWQVKWPTQKTTKVLWMEQDVQGTRKIFPKAKQSGVGDSVNRRLLKSSESLWVTVRHALRSRSGFPAPPRPLV